MGSSFNQIEENAEEEKQLWLRDQNIKRETESLITAAQELAMRTNTIKTKIKKTQAESKYRMCGKVDGTVRHIVCECPMLAQREYKKSHDQVGRKIVANDSWKILQDVTVQTDHVIEARRLDTVIIDETKNECMPL